MHVCSPGLGLGFSMWNASYCVSFISHQSCVRMNVLNLRSRNRLLCALQTPLVASISLSLIRQVDREFSRVQLNLSLTQGSGFPLTAPKSESLIGNRRADNSLFRKGQLRREGTAVGRGVRGLKGGGRVTLCCAKHFALGGSGAREPVDIPLSTLPCHLLLKAQTKDRKDRSGFGVLGRHLGWG